MASKIEVSVKVVGGRMKVVEVDAGASVSDVIKAASLDGKYSATINSNPAELSDTVEEGMTVFLAPQVKGAGGDKAEETEVLPTESTPVATEELAIAQPIAEDQKA